MGFPLIAKMFGSRSKSKVLVSQPEFEQGAVSRALSGGAFARTRNIDQDALVKMIQNAMSSNRSPAQLAAEIAGGVKNGSLANSPAAKHPMFEFEAESPNLPSFHKNFTDRSGSLPAGFAPPCAFYTPSPSQRRHDHY